MSLVGYAFYPMFNRARAGSRAVAARRAGSIAVELDKLGIIDICPEGVLYGV